MDVSNSTEIQTLGSLKCGNTISLRRYPFLLIFRLFNIYYYSHYYFHIVNSIDVMILAREQIPSKLIAPP